MKKNLTFSIISMVVLLAVIVLAASCSENAKPDKKTIVVVNSATISMNSELGKTLTAYLRGAITDMEKNLTALQEKTLNAPNDEKARNALRQAEIEFEMKAREVNDRVVNLFAEYYVKALNEYREKNGIDLILPVESINSFNPAIDVTDQVITLMNSYGVPEGYGPAPAANATPANQTAANASANQTPANATPANQTPANTTAANQTNKK